MTPGPRTRGFAGSPSTRGDISGALESAYPGLEALSGRIVEAMVAVVCERGFAGASVSRVSARARVSRRTFYKAFESLEACFLAVLDEGAWRVGLLMSGAFAGEEVWVDGVRGALVALLRFLDSEPEWAWVLLVEATAAGPRARERREWHVAGLTVLIEGHWDALREGHAHWLVNGGVMASLLGVLHTHLVTGREQPLIGLLGPMMGLVTTPIWSGGRSGRRSRGGNRSRGSCFGIGVTVAASVSC